MKREKKNQIYFGKFQGNYLSKSKKQRIQAYREEKHAQNKEKQEYLGEAPTRTSLLNRSGLLMEAKQPIMPDMEWPTKLAALRSI